MSEHDLLSPHGAKAVEYLISIAYLVLFVPFWRYLQGTPKPAPAPVRVFDWFRIPDGFHVHPGHAWATAFGEDQAKVGLDDFGHRLVGPLEGLSLPGPGTVLTAGQPAFSLVAGGKTLAVRSPVGGVVVAVNRLAEARPGELWKDPYGGGWLLTVSQRRRLLSDVDELLTGEFARRFLEKAAGALAARMSPVLGDLAQDGGTPVHGIARELDPERWDELVRSHFLTS